MHSRLMSRTAAGILLAAVVMSSCSFLPGGKGGRSSGNSLIGDKKHSDKYKSAEEYCGYWFGPCKEIDSYPADSKYSDNTIHVMKDKEFGFEYTVSGDDRGYFLGGCDFAYYYIDEFLSGQYLKDITEEYDLEFENRDSNKIGSPSLWIRTDLELSAEDNKKIMAAVMSALDEFDFERKVFNKPHDNISVFIALWSAPWEHDTNIGALYHVENETFGDNYKEQ